MKTAGQVRIHVLERAAEDEEFRARLIEDPPGTIEKELGVGIPEGLKIRVLQDGTDTASIALAPQARLEAAALAAVSASHVWSNATSNPPRSKEQE